MIGGTLGVSGLLPVIKINMEIAIFQFVIGAKKEIFEKMLQIIRCRMNIILQIVVVGAHESVAKIPGMIFERFIID